MFYSFFKNYSPSCEILPQKNSCEYIVVKVATSCQCASIIELNVFEFLKLKLYNGGGGEDKNK
jgi:hypothetical protein